MPRLSSPIEDIKDHYTVVVVGSGYGGGIAASRLARAGQTVCLLERGKERQPGEYPDTLPEAAREIQVDTPLGHVGSHTAMFDFRVNHDMNVLIGCGLGGTSLINASVSLHAEPRVFEDPRWPEELRRDAGTLLAEGYRRAEEMLRPVPYPEDFPPLPKLEAQARSAAFMKERFYRPPINVTFMDGVNHLGVPQRRCQLCGDCVTGCNYAAKNTTLMNYLPDARNHGVEIFTEVAVRYVERRDGRWLAHFQVLGEGREAFRAPDLFVTADVVVLAAGTLGSTEILLRSRAKGLPLSGRLGERFTGNGEVLGFGYNCEEPINGVGFGHRKPGHMDPVGPCIAGIVDLRERPQLDDGMVIEEGTIPGALGPLLPAALEAEAAAVGEGTGSGLRRAVGEKARALESLLLGPHAGAVRHTQTYLVMSHDDAAGRLYLADDRLRIDWSGVGSQPVFRRINERLKEATAALKGVYVENPIWSEVFEHRLISVHPLGGCVMAERAEEGVVDHKGRVFAGPAGSRAHEGLYVADGAIIPRSLGVSPLLTICALAERNCALLARDRRWTIDYGLPPPPRARAEARRRVGVRFTESMKGYFSTQVKDDHERGAERGRADGSTLEFVLTIVSEDLERMLSSPEHPARMFGTVAAPELSSRALTVTEGTFNLFVADEAHVQTLNMRYRTTLRSEEGRVYFFNGFKVIKPDLLRHLWAATTTLYVTVYDGKDASAPVVGKGILTIHPADFLRQLTTMEAINAETAALRLTALARFGRFFAGRLFETYGGVFAGPSGLGPESPPRKKRPLRTEAPEVHFFEASDGVALRTVRFKGGGKGPVLVAPGFGTSTLAFSVDTVETNLPEYLSTKGYDVWLFDYRASPALPSARTQFTLDDVATKDWPAAVDYVRRATGAGNLQVIGHCMGSMTCFMALLAGLAGVRSFVASQVTLHPVTSTVDELKAAVHLGTAFAALGVNSLTTDIAGDFKDEVIDKVLKLYPIPEAERCASPVCRRIFAIYGQVYKHAQLNEATHEALGEMFGVANMATFRQILEVIRTGHVVDKDGNDVYMPHLERLAIPITFLAGADNKLFLPKGSEKTFLLLSDKNGPDLYARHVIPNYAHMDWFVGRDAAREVFPLIVDALDRGN